MTSPGRILLSTLAALAVTTGTAFAALGSDREAAGAVVVVAESGHDRGMGSGTIVARFGNRIRVLTAKHVATYGALTLQLSDQASVPAHILTLVPGHDLAIVEADVTPTVAAELHVVPIARAQRSEAVHIWGSGVGGPALETGAVSTVGELPDGPARGRIGIACDTCHQGDSGGGVFDTHGDLVGVYIGFFTLDSGRLSIAEIPDDATRVALAPPADASTVASAQTVRSAMVPATDNFAK
jgi:S1-C subfamily serine protease